MKKLYGIMILPMLSACVAITVEPVSRSDDIGQVCIIKNPKVIITDFVPVLQDGFARHGINTTVLDAAQAAQNCHTTLTYTALRSWDMSPYLSHAELRLWRGGKAIGSADYHLVGRGGLYFGKWQSTKTKMDPVIDRLLGKPATHTTTPDEQPQGTVLLPIN